MDNSEDKIKFLNILCCKKGYIISKQDLVGTRFGKLIPISRISKYKNDKTYYNCKCDCGSDIIVYSYDLSSEKVNCCKDCKIKSSLLRQKTIDRIGNVYGNLIILDVINNYGNKHKTYYKCLCKCGNERIVNSYSLLNGQITACKECSEQRGHEKRRKNRVGERYGKLVVTEMLYNYNNTKKTYVKCKCDCGNEKILQMNNVINSHTTSCGCREIQSRFERSHCIDIKGKKFNKLTVLEKTDKKKINGSIIWKCKCDCGNITFVSYSDLTRNQVMSCGCIHGSQWEALINNLLKEHNTNYTFQMKFDDCKNKEGNSVLPFDFYLHDLNTVIEYDGEHHFKPISYWGGEEKFKATQQNDKIKNEYCKQHGIRIIRLNYKQKKEEIIQQILKILNP